MTPTGDHTKASGPEGQPNVSQTSSSVRLISAADAHLAFAELAEKVEPPPVVYGLWRWLVARAFDSRYARHAGRGAVELWHSDLYGDGRWSRSSVERGFVWLRSHGLVVGRPNDPDPTNDWYRDRALYRLTVPAACRAFLNKLRHRAARKLDELRRSNDASTVTGQRARSHLERDGYPLTVCVEPTDAAPPPWGQPPDPLWPPGRVAVRQWLEARKR
jgi:hypothetical protein